MTTFRRWTWIVVLAIIGAFEFVLLLPTAAVYTNRIWIPPWYSRWFVVATTFALSLALLRIAMDPIRIHSTQFRHVLKYPPLWLSVVAALFLAAGIDLIPLELRPVRASLRWWSDYTWLCVTGLLLLAAARLPAPRSKPRISTANDITAWATTDAPIESAAEDRLGHAEIADRIATRLTGNVDQSIALLGPLGSGKTSILNLVRKVQSPKSAPRLWYVQVNCWGIENSALAPAYILEQLVNAVEGFVDCQQLRGIPLAYRRMMQVETSGRLSRLFEPFHVVDPVAVLGTLSPLLECLGVRIVILLEDADRSAGTDFDPQHIERLLWSLRNIERLTFIVAAKFQFAIDFAKLCDHIEILPRIDPLDVTKNILEARDKCLSKFTDIESAPDFEDRLKLKAIGDDTLERLMSASYGLTPGAAVGVLLDTPRRLKLAMRRLQFAWDAVHGEVYFNDLLVLCVLREGAPDAFNFIVHNMDAARQEAKTDLETLPKQVKAAWDRLISEHPQGESVQKLVNTLGFAQLSRDGTMPQVHPQGVAHMEPSDYLRRALSERVAPGEVPDQVVLADIVAFRDGKSQVMVEQLSSTWDTSPYVRRWEHFSSLLPTASLLPLAAKVIDHRLNNIHTSEGEKDEPILAIWRRVNRRLNKNDPKSVEWLADQVVRTLPHSLSYAHALYYFWASRQHGIVNETGRTKVREAVYRAAQSVFTHGAALRAAISPSDNWDLRHLVQPVDHQEPASVFTSPTEWRWLAPIVIAALQEDPAIADHVAALIGDASTKLERELEQESPSLVQRTTYQLDETRVREMFGSLATDLLAAFSTSAPKTPMVEEVVSQLSAFVGRSETT